jgi:YggT family protein
VKVFVIGNLLQAIAGLLDFLFQLLMVVLVVNAVLSWVRPDPSQPIVAFIDRVSDFVCNPIRKLFPTVFSGIDFAPLIVMLVVYFVGRMFLVETLRGMALRMG